jgi:hypothetical protein
VKLRKTLTGVKGYEQLDRCESLGDGGCDPRAELVEALPRLRRDLDCVGMAQPQLAAILWIQEIDLVHDEQARLVPRPDLLQHLVRRFDRIHALLLGLRAVDDVQDEVGEHRLLEGRLECLDQRVWQLADEAHRVREQDPPPVMGESPGGRVECSPTPTPAPVSAFSRVDLPAFV